MHQKVRETVRYHILFVIFSYPFSLEMSSDSVFIACFIRSPVSDFSRRLLLNYLLNPVLSFFSLRDLFMGKCP